VAELGYLAIVLALGACAFSIVASVAGGLRDAPALVASGRRAMVAAAGLSTVACVIMLGLFLAGDYTVLAVWKNSSRTTPLLYVVTGLWGSQEGSLLFWSALQAGFVGLVLLRPWRADRALIPWFTATSAVITGFFLLLVAFVANPFARLEVVPADGSGLNPLLQHPGMAFHPPTLYLGFTGMSIPFAFAIAALIAGRLDAGWIAASRRWLLVAWAFLTVGLTLGGRWAYDVLGWGGYWGWDPVENAAFMPWLAATAYLHSVMVQERRGMFRVWNMFLIITTFGLVIVGTFLTRAGLVSSVHAFAQSNIGGYFLVFTALLLVGSLLLLWWRLPLLRAPTRIESLLSRETAFLGNNLLLMGALFAVFWGTLFPLFAEILTGERASVKATYFNQVVLPIFGLTVLLMGIGPLVGWRRTRPRALAKLVAGPALATLIVMAVLAVLGVRQWVALAGFTVCFFAFFATLVELGRGVRARMRLGESPPTAALRLISRQRRRYGGYIVHLGVILFALGVTGNVYQLEAERTLAMGESLAIGDYVLRFDGLRTVEEPDRNLLLARLLVSDAAGRPLGLLEPAKAVFRLREEQPMTLPAVRTRPLEDLYALLGAYNAGTTAEGGAGSQSATVKVYVNPLVSYVWLGMLVLVFGTLVAAWPDGSDARLLAAELRRLRSGPGKPATPATGAAGGGA
jgi:cytochrome c-type biogenesis protein CcmF